MAEVSLPIRELTRSAARKIAPGSFEPENHFYPRVLNAQVHPLVSFFMNMGRARIVERYCHLNPAVNPESLEKILSFAPRFFRWAGADLFCTTNAEGNRRMVLIETNSCPSGNKSMPLLSDDQEQGGYRTLMERMFYPLLKRRGLPEGALAVLYDKNFTEASGYAAALADLTGESVYLTPLPADAEDPPARFRDRQLEVRTDAGNWIPIRAAFRYVTQRPWTRIPVNTKTLIANPVIACLAGGRNKLMGAKAYDYYNGEIRDEGLSIRFPETIWDVRRAEIPFLIDRFGGHAVVKVPYANAGQGVFTITSKAELEAFMEQETRYDHFVVQSLIGNSSWSSRSRTGRYFHVGTIPNRRGEIFVADLRIMVCASEEGFEPLAIYARRAPSPLTRNLDADADSWSMLGTNLSVKQKDGGWAAETDRLLLMDRRDFNKLGLGVDDLIEAFVQTVLATIAIDKLGSSLVSTKGQLKRKLLRSLDDDETLLGEIMPSQASVMPAPEP